MALRYLKGRRPRRPDDGKYLEKDARKWRRLVKLARRQMWGPLADAETLRKAAEACARAVPPPGYATRDSRFLALTLAARGFCQVASADREAKAAALAALADVCEAALNGPEPPDRPARADIFG